MTAIRPGRRLGAIERALLLESSVQPLNLVAAVRLAGPTLREVLPSALAGLQVRHPLLRARIRDVGSRPSFEVLPDVGVIPIQFAERVDETTWIARYERELSVGFDVAVAPLARCTYVHGIGDRSELLVALHHCAIDGVSADSLLHELLERCEALLDGRVGSRVDPLALIPAADTLLPVERLGSRGAMQVVRFGAREGAKELRDRALSCAGRRPIPPPSANRVLVSRLSTVDTSAVLGAARRHGITMTSVLCAAMLVEVDRRLYRGRRKLLRVVTFADLRPNLRPPVSAHNMGTYVALIRVSVRVDPNDGLWAVAREVQERLSASLDRGDRFSALRLSAVLARANVRFPSARMADVALSYSPGHRVSLSYGPLRVSELHGCVSNSPTGAEVAAVAGVFDGELWFDVPYLGRDLDEQSVKNLVDSVAGLLIEAAR